MHNLTDKMILEVIFRVVLFILQECAAIFGMITSAMFIADHCQVDMNHIATNVDALIGIVFGLLIIFIVILFITIMAFIWVALRDYFDQI